MSYDGADMGVLPQRALETIVGWEGQPSKEERMSPEQMRDKIMAQPDRYEDIVGIDGIGYENTTLWLAKQFLKLMEEGLENSNEDALYAEMEKRNGDKDYDFTGFMVGYANNVARYCLGKPSQPNPAIMEIKNK